MALHISNNVFGGGKVGISVSNNSQMDITVVGNEFEGCETAIEERDITMEHARALRDLIQNLPDVSPDNKSKACNVVDKMVSAQTGQQRQTLLNSICGFVGQVSAGLIVEYVSKQMG